LKQPSRGRFLKQNSVPELAKHDQHEQGRFATETRFTSYANEQAYAGRVLKVAGKGFALHTSGPGVPNLLSFMVPPMAYTLSLSFGLPVLWSEERGLTAPATQATARVSPRLAQIWGRIEEFRVDVVITIFDIF
jgi:hypothetical protein